MGTVIGTQTSRVESLQQLAPGDHIRYPSTSSSSKAPIDHHAIVTQLDDTGVTVIHRVGRGADGGSARDEATGDCAGKPRIVEEAVDIERHLKTGSLCQYEYATGECFHPDFIILRARTQLVLPPDYSILGRNSEYFARWSTNANELSYKALYITVAALSVIGMIAVIYARYAQIGIFSRDEL